MKEEKNTECGFCHCGSEKQGCGDLHQTEIKKKVIAAHAECMKYSSKLTQYSFEHFGGFKLDKVVEELERGKKCRCNKCKRTGATAGCAISTCKKTYHFVCGPVTEKIIHTCPEKGTRVLYRLFCGEAHQKSFMKELDDLGAEMEESSSESEPEDDPEYQPSGGDAYLGNRSKQRKMKLNSGVKTGRGRIQQSKGRRGRPPKVDKLPGGDADLENRSKQRKMKLNSGVKTGRGRIQQSKGRRGRPPKVDKLPVDDAGAERTSEKKEVMLTSEKKSSHYRQLKKRRGRPPLASKFSDTSSEISNPSENMKRKFSEIASSSDSDETDVIIVGVNEDLQGSKKHKRRASQTEKDEIKMQVGSNSDNVEEDMSCSKVPFYQNEPRHPDGRRDNLSSPNFDHSRQGPSKREDNSSSHLTLPQGNSYGTEMESKEESHRLTPEASYSDSGSFVEIEQQLEDNDFNTNTVFLLIPSQLNVLHEDLEAVCKDLGTSWTQSILWPPLDKWDTLQDKHLPHFMSDIVLSLRENDWSRLKSVLAEGSTSPYDSVLQHLSGKDITKEVLENVDKMLANLDEDIASLKTSKHKNLAVLAIRLLSDQTEHREIISSLRSQVFEWEDEVGMKSIFSKPKKPEEELELLWKWFMSEIKCGFRIEMIPGARTEYSLDKILFDENFSSEVVRELMNNLKDLKEKLSFNNGSVAVVALDGINRELLSFKAFVRRTIDSLTEDSDCKDIYLIVSLYKTDNLAEVSEILPDHLASCVTIYTAFNPEVVCPSCILLHVSKTDCRNSYNSSVMMVHDTGSSHKETFEAPETELQGTTVNHRKSLDIDLSVVRTDNEESMYFQPVDAVWQREKASLLGLNIKNDIPLSSSGQVSRLEPPKNSVPVRKDGNCYFRAISHVLVGNQREHKTIRNLIFRFMVENDDQFSKLADCPNYAESRSIDKNGVWATEIEIFATASMLDTDVNVFSPCGCDKRDNTVYKWLTYKPLQDVLPLEGVRELRNTNKWVTYKLSNTVTLPPKFRKNRKAIYLSNIADHYEPVYKL